jgi:hypothetical protein
MVGMESEAGRRRNGGTAHENARATTKTQAGTPVPPAAGRMPALQESGIGAHRAPLQVSQVNATRPVWARGTAG